MPTVDCKLIDCSKHAAEGTKCRGNVNIDMYGDPVCYDPVPRSALVHEPVNPRCYKDRGGGYKSSRVTGVLK